MITDVQSVSVTYHGRKVGAHDLDFERLWLNYNRTDRSIMLSLSKGANPSTGCTTRT